MFNDTIIFKGIHYIEGMENWTPDQWENYRMKGHTTFDDKEFNRFIEVEIIPEIEEESIKKVYQNTDLDLEEKTCK